jgi:hypothetical protein
MTVVKYLSSVDGLCVGDLGYGFFLIKHWVE